MALAKERKRERERECRGAIPYTIALAKERKERENRGVYPCRADPHLLPVSQRPSDPCTCVRGEGLHPSLSECKQERTNTPAYAGAGKLSKRVKADHTWTPGIALARKGSPRLASLQASQQASPRACQPAAPRPTRPARLTHREASTAGSLPLKAPPVRAASCPCTTTAIICRYSSCVFAHAQPLFEDLDVKSSLHHTFFITILTCIICPSLRKSVDWRKKRKILTLLPPNAHAARHSFEVPPLWRVRGLQLSRASSCRSSGRAPFDGRSEHCG